MFLHERTSRVNVWIIHLTSGRFLDFFLAAWLIQVVGWRAGLSVLAGLHSITFLGEDPVGWTPPLPALEKDRDGRLNLLYGHYGSRDEG